MIDAHLHLWDPAMNDYPWLSAESALNRTFLLSEVGPAGQQIDGFIVVEAGCQDPEREVDWLRRFATRWPVIRGVVAQVPLERGREVASSLGDVARDPLIVGVRRNVQDEPAGFLLTAAMVAGVRQLATHNLPFDACVREHQLGELTDLVDRCPQVTFVLDHLGKPDIRRRRRQPWFDDLTALARRPNVVAKLSGLTTEADHERWRPAEITPYLAHALETFGPDRCLFGSDWPVMTLATTYRRWVDLVLDAIADLSDVERAAVLAGTASRTYHLNPPTAT